MKISVPTGSDREPDDVEDDEGDGQVAQGAAALALRDILQHLEDDGERDARQNHRTETEHDELLAPHALNHHHLRVNNFILYVQKNCL